MSTRGVNKVIVVGNLGDDPEVKPLPDGSAMVKMSVATSEQWINKNTGNQEQNTEWHKIVVFGKLAEICEKYLVKGSKVYIEGSLHTRSWDDEHGNRRYMTEIKAKEMQMLDSKGEGQQRQPAKQPVQDYNEMPGSFDDEIPF